MEKGVVIKSTGSWYKVLNQKKEIILCRIKGKFRLQDIETTNPIAVGDNVFYELTEDKTGIITEIQERKNYIIRKSVNLSKKAHILASNIDLALLIVTLKEPKTYLSFIDRFLVSAEAYQIPVCLVFNKVDLLNPQELIRLTELTAVYSKIGYPCIQTSVNNNTGIAELKKIITNKTVVLSGHSGVGKSSLINLIDPALSLKIGQISSQHKQGKHTTTFAEMHLLNTGGYIIDTPGIKGLGLVDLDKNEICRFYPEMRAQMEQCKFNNCVHINEPDCAVKKAVKNGNIAEFRYKSYLSLYENEEDSGYRENLYEPK